jgi:hypothetical protein
MANPLLSWDRPVKEIWVELAEPTNDPDAPYCRKLALLAQLKAAQAGENAAEAVAGYTKWLMRLTAVIVLCTVVQTGIVVLTYLRLPSH